MLSLIVVDRQIGCWKQRKTIMVDFKHHRADCIWSTVTFKDNCLPDFEHSTQNGTIYLTSLFRCSILKTNWKNTQKWQKTKIHFRVDSICSTVTFRNKSLPGFEHSTQNGMRHLISLSRYSFLETIWKLGQNWQKTKIMNFVLYRADCIQSPVPFSNESLPEIEHSTLNGKIHFTINVQLLFWYI